MHMWGCGGLRKYRVPFFALSICLLDLHVIKGAARFKVTLPNGSTALSCSLIYKHNIKLISECTASTNIHLQKQYMIQHKHQLFPCKQTYQANNMGACRSDTIQSVLCLASGFILHINGIII